MLGKHKQFNNSTTTHRTDMQPTLYFLRFFGHSNDMYYMRWEAKLQNWIFHFFLFLVFYNIRINPNVTNTQTIQYLHNCTLYLF